MFLKNAFEKSENRTELKEDNGIYYLEPKIETPPFVPTHQLVEDVKNVYNYQTQQWIDCMPYGTPVIVSMPVLSPRLSIHIREISTSCGCRWFMDMSRLDDCNKIVSL